MAFDLVLGQTKRDWSCGSILLPEKQELSLLNKVDDIRYDVRRAQSNVSGAIYALSGALAAVALTSIYRQSNRG